MTTSTAIKQNETTAANATRFPADFGGIKLEYIRKRATIAKLFHLEDLAKEYPSLNLHVPVRIYYVAGTNTQFEHPLVPVINPNYRFDIWDLSVLLPYFVSCKGFPPYIYGLHGTGKSSLIEQIHARLGLPKMNVILGEDSEVIDLGGQMLPTEAGGMRFFDGLLVQTMRNGWTLQIDEYDLLPTRQQKMLNEVLENRRFTIEVTGEQVKAHPDWRCTVTANTNNTGGGSHMFVKSGSGDASVNERFQFLEKQYLQEEEEFKILEAEAKMLLAAHPKVLKNPDLTDQLMLGVSEIIRQILKVADLIRNAYKLSLDANNSNSGVALNCTMSTRAAREWLRSTIDLSIFFDGAKGSVMMELTRRAFCITFVKGVDEEEQADVLQIFDDAIGTNV
ncbi:hypothetical protein DDN60_18230 [Vibrio cholerae]|nr:hypothetical protein [Vibrio cholerae]